MKIKQTITMGAIVLATVGLTYGDTYFDGFESYTQGTLINSQGNWVTSNETTTQRSTVVAGGSAFGGGSNSLLYKDNDATANIGGITARTDPDLSTPNGPMVVSFDFNIVNGLWSPTLWVYSDAGQNAIKLTFFQNDSPTGTDANLGKVRNSNVNVSETALSLNQWYRAELTIGDLSAATDTYDLRVLAADGGSGTEVINVTGLAFSTNVGDIDRFLFNAANSAPFARNGSEFNLDNIEVIPEPATLGLIGAVSAGLLVVRRFMLV